MAYSASSVNPISSGRIPFLCSSFFTRCSLAMGIVRGLAWTSAGGDTLQIEVNMMPGGGEIDLTGQMGDVMKESARIAMSYVRSVGERYQSS